MTRYLSRLDEIERRYNPEFDIPQGEQPPVTWAEMYLAEALKIAIKEIEELRQEIESIKAVDDDY
jgi:hypothetical protein